MFSVDLRVHEIAGHAIVSLRGELDVADSAAVAAELAGVAASRPAIVVDMAGVGFMDVSGVAALVRGREHARLAGGDLVLAAPGPRVQRVLTLICLADAFLVHGSVAEAVASAGWSGQSASPVRGDQVRSTASASP
jgi:anti-sigma B factor antagonist